jgi:hypothetical protein
MRNLRIFILFVRLKCIGGSRSGSPVVYLQLSLLPSYRQSALPPAEQCEGQFQIRRFSIRFESLGKSTRQRDCSHSSSINAAQLESPPASTRGIRASVLPNRRTAFPVSPAISTVSGNQNTSSARRRPSDWATDVAARAVRWWRAAADQRRHALRCAISYAAARAPPSDGIKLGPHHVGADHHRDG